MFVIFPGIWYVISPKVVLVLCGEKIKNSCLNTFFYQSSKLSYVKVLDTWHFFQISNQKFVF